MKFLHEHHLVWGWEPHEINGAIHTTTPVSLKLHHHASIFLVIGATTGGGDADIVVNAHPDVAMSATVALNNYTFRKSTTPDVWTAEVLIADSKIDYVAAGDVIPTTDTNTIVLIDIDADQVAAAAANYDCLTLTFPDPGQNIICGAYLILSRPRYARAAQASAIVD